MIKDTGEYMLKKFLNFTLDISICIAIMVMFYLVIQNFTAKEKYRNLFGYTFLEVLTGSMTDTIKIGDGVIVELTKDIKENDIIVYQKENELITHRLIKKEENELITKGDANNVQDEPITEDMVIGKVIKIFPNINVWKKRMYAFLILLMIVVIIIKIIINKKHKNQ